MKNLYYYTILTFEIDFSNVFWIAIDHKTTGKSMCLEIEYNVDT